MVSFLNFAFNPARGSFPWRPRTSLVTECARRGVLTSAANALCLVDSLDRAIQRGYVQEFGNQINLDSEGFLHDNEHLFIPKEQVHAYRDIAKTIRKTLAHHKVKAIFVRGSALSGNLFEDSRSDLDLVIFTNESVGAVEKRQLRHRLAASVRNKFRVKRTDIRYLHKRGRRGLSRHYSISPSLRITLRYFAVPIFGSMGAVGMSDAPLQPRPHQAINIQSDVNRFRVALASPDAADNFFLQLAAIQWLCKKCLRAVAELSAVKTGAFARDLLPCYKLGSSAYPDYARTMCKGLLIACSSPENRYLDMRKNELIQKGTAVALHFAEIVEELALRECFGSRFEFSNAQTVVSSDVLLSTAGLLDRFDQLKETFFAWFLSFRRPASLSNYDFRRRPLPALELEGSRFVDMYPRELDIETPGGTCDIQTLFTDVSEPIVYRDTLHTRCDNMKVTMDVLECLLQTVPSVQCRVAPSFDVTFCRSKHPWIDELTFTPPSILVSLSVTEAVCRLAEDHALPHLMYDGCDDECVYIQTNSIPSLRVFNMSSTEEWHVAQEERLWISSHGTVSTLHYDASYSALYQRCGQKRLIFFPPSCLPKMGIYPLGHPLHRRARVDLTSKDTDIFQGFWDICASQAIEVTLQPGDLLIFPPFWAHYTESITSTKKALSISHTLRYVSRGKTL